MLLSKKEQKALKKSKTKDTELEKSIKIPFFYFWTKDKYQKTFTRKGYPEGAGLMTKDGKKPLRIPRFKIWLNSAKFYMPVVMLLVGLVIFIFSFIAAFPGEWQKSFSQILSVIPGWNGPLGLTSCCLFALGLWFGFYGGSKFLLYLPYRKKQLKAQSVIDVQTKNQARIRKKYGTLSFEDILPKLGPGKTFNVTIMDNPTTLHDNLGWMIKGGITNDPTEISLLKKGLISKRMWEERPNDLTLKYLDEFEQHEKVPDKSYVYYIVTCSIDKLHVFNEGDTGSGKTQSFATPEVVHTLKHKSHPSVIFTCKGGDEKVAVNQAKSLDIKIQHIQLNKPGESASFNPLYVPYLLHDLKCQLKYSTHPRAMNITPADWESQYDIEIRQKDLKYIEFISDISSKEQLMAELERKTGDVAVDRLLPNWKDSSVTLQDVVETYKSWENNKWIIVQIKKHFLFTDRFNYWTESRKKATNVWYKCGNWIFESVDEYEKKKELLLAQTEAAFQTMKQSVITNIMNEDQKKSTDSFWGDQARLYISTFIDLFFELKEMGNFSDNKISLSDAYFNLPTVCAWVNNYCASADKMKDFVAMYAPVLKTIKDHESNLVLPEETFQSVVGNINAITQDYSASSELLPIITNNDFNPLDFGLKQILLCITTNNNASAKANLLLKDVVGQTLNCCNLICDNNNGTMPRPIRIIADEAGSGAPIPYDNIQAVATKGRSQKILEGLYYQTIKQVNNQYPNKEGAKEEMFGNMALKRCIKSSADDSLEQWTRILGQGLSTTLEDVDKKEHLSDSTGTTSYFPPDYIRNKPQWNVLEKLGEMKTIDVTSCPIYPTQYQRALAIEAKKHEPPLYKKRAVTQNNFWANCYLDLEKVLEFLANKISANENYSINFNLLVEAEVTTASKQKTVLTDFGMRFSPTSLLQNAASAFDAFSEWEIEQEREQVNIELNKANNDDVSIDNILGEDNAEQTPTAPEVAPAFGEFSPDTSDQDEPEELTADEDDAVDESDAAELADEQDLDKFLDIGNQ